MRVTLVIDMESDAAPESVMMVVQHLRGVREVSGTVVRNARPPPPPPLGPDGTPPPKPSTMPRPRPPGTPKLPTKVETTGSMRHPTAEQAKSMGFTGDMCLQCGLFAMKRSGTCLACQNCGTTTGCS